MVSLQASPTVVDRGQDFSSTMDQTDSNRFSTFRQLNFLATCFFIIPCLIVDSFKFIHYAFYNMRFCFLYIEIFNRFKTCDLQTEVSSQPIACKMS